MKHQIREFESQCWEPRKYGPAWFDSEKFAKLVAAAEREACVKLFKDKEGLWDSEGIVYAIRARGNA